MQFNTLKKLTIPAAVAVFTASGVFAQTSPAPVPQVQFSVQTTDGGGAQRQVLAGKNSQGPYTLEWRNVKEQSEQVRVDGLVYRRGFDYQIDYALGAITFLAPVSSRAQIEVQYDLAPGAQKATAQAVGTVAVDTPLISQGGTKLNMIGAYTPSADRKKSANTLLGFSGSVDQGKGLAMSGAFATDVTGAQDAKSSERMGFKFDTKASNKTTEWTTSVLHTGQQFAGAGAWGAKADTDQFSTELKFNPSSAMSAAMGYKSGSVEGKGTGSRYMTLALTPSAAIKTSLGYMQSMEPGKDILARTFAIGFTPNQLMSAQFNMSEGTLNGADNNVRNLALAMTPIKGVTAGMNWTNTETGTTAKEVTTTKLGFSQGKAALSFDQIVDSTDAAGNRTGVVTTVGKLNIGDDWMRLTGDRNTKITDTAAATVVEGANKYQLSLVSRDKRFNVTLLNEGVDKYQETQAGQAGVMNQRYLLTANATSPGLNNTLIAERLANRSLNPAGDTDVGSLKLALISVRTSPKLTTTLAAERTTTVTEAPTSRVSVEAQRAQFVTQRNDGMVALAHHERVVTAVDGAPDLTEAEKTVLELVSSQKQALTFKGNMTMSRINEKEMQEMGVRVETATALPFKISTGYTEKRGDLAPGERASDIKVTAQAAKNLSVEGLASTKNVGNDSFLQHEARVVAQPAEGIQLSGSMAQVGKNSDVGYTRLLSALVQPNKQLAVKADHKLRMKTGTQSLETAGVMMSFTPNPLLSFSGSFIYNPENDKGVVQRVSTSEYRLTANNGHGFALTGAMNEKQDTNTRVKARGLDLGMAWKLSPFSELVTGRNEQAALGANDYNQISYRLGYRSAINNGLNITFEVYQTRISRPETLGGDDSWSEFRLRLTSKW